MSSGSPIRQTQSLSQNQNADFLNTASSITVPELALPAPEAFAAASPEMFAASASSATGSGTLIGPISATGSFTNFLVSAGNLSINLEFDSSAVAAGSTFMSGIEQAASILVADLHVNNTATINLEIQYNETLTSGATLAPGDAAAQTLSGTSFSYTAVRNALINNAPGDANFNALPIGSSVTGTDGTTAATFSTIDVWSAEEKALGLFTGTVSALDGLADFGSGIAGSLLVGVALHELTHAMGRIPDGPTSADIFDLFRFSAPGTILASNAGSATAPASYFSVDGGTTALASYGTTSDPSDLLNTGGLQDPFTESYDASTPQTLTALDLTQMDVLGFSTACFAEDTALATPDGDIQVQLLRPGMRVLTAWGIARPVRWIGYRRVDLTRHAAPEEACPIRIRAGALGQGVPLRDLRLSPEHALLLDGGLVPARLLVNGSSILRESDCRHVVWFHVELDSHDIVLAEGAPTETYLDTGNRGLFENASVPLVLHPRFSDGQADRVARSCAPFLDDAASVEAIWRRVAGRAAELGFGPTEALATTPDPALVLRMNGHLFRATSVTAGRHVFVLPSVMGPVRLVSRATIPHALHPWIADRRTLGVLVSSVTIRREGTTHIVAADDPALADGWHAPESGASGPCRWTNGNAALPVDAGAAAVVEIACETLPDYVLEPGAAAARSAA